MIDLSKGEIVIFTDETGQNKVDIIKQNDNLWMSAEKIGKLFGKDRTSIIKHINNIYKTNELDKNSTCEDFAQVQKEGNGNIKTTKFGTAKYL